MQYYHIRITSTLFEFLEKVIRLSHPNFRTNFFNFLTKTLQDNHYLRSLITRINNKTISKMNNTISQHNQE